MSNDERIDKLLAQCKEDEDTVEVPKGSNSGKRVNAMLRNTGLGPHYPWCAAAVTTWGLEAIGASWPVPRTADCDRILSWARAKGVLHKSGPERGDIFLVMKSSDDAIHTGIVSSVIDSDTVRTWEGNTNGGGSRNGHGVFYRKRSRHNLWYVRWIDAVSVPAEVKTPTPVYSSSWQVWVSPHGFFPSAEDKLGRPCVPIRPFVASLLGISLEATEDIIGWDGVDNKALIYGKSIDGTYTKGSTGWAPVREISEAMGFVVSVSSSAKPTAKKIVTVSAVEK